MKKTIMLVAAIAVMAAAQAKTVKSKFKVSGNCEICESRIEKTAGQVQGVVSASWNRKTQSLSVVYDNAKTSDKKVQQALAAAGHDAGSFKAPKATYDKLPACCKYRK